MLVGDQRRVRLKALSEGVTSQAAVVEFINRRATANTLSVVDCSLVVKNKKGQWPCETLIARTFGQYHASCS